MTVKELKDKLANLPDYSEVVISHWLTGQWYELSGMDESSYEEDLETGDVVDKHITVLQQKRRLSSNQAAEWEMFSMDVHSHIDNYVIPQYGDSDQDQVSNYTANDMKTNLMRYVGRIESGQRGKEESLRDCKKIAHYACRLNLLLQKGE